MFPFGLSPYSPHEFCRSVGHQDGSPAHRYCGKLRESGRVGSPWVDVEPAPVAGKRLLPALQEPSRGAFGNSRRSSQECLLREGAWRRIWAVPPGEWAGNRAAAHLHHMTLYCPPSPL